MEDVLNYILNIFDYELYIKTISMFVFFIEWDG